MRYILIHTHGKYKCHIACNECLLSVVSLMIWNLPYLNRHGHYSLHISTNSVPTFSGRLRSKTLWHVNLYRILMLISWIFHTWQMSVQSLSLTIAHCFPLGWRDEASRAKFWLSPVCFWCNFYTSISVYAVLFSFCHAQTAKWSYQPICLLWLHPHNIHGDCHILLHHA